MPEATIDSIGDHMPEPAQEQVWSIPIDHHPMFGELMPPPVIYWLFTGRRGILLYR